MLIIKINAKHLYFRKHSIFASNAFLLFCLDLIVLKMRTRVLAFVVLSLICYVNMVFSQPSADVVVTANGHNILYTQFDNIVFVGVKGVKNERLVVQISNGTITGGNGRYRVNVISLEETKVTVSEKADDGSLILHGSVTFGVKPLPAPQICFGDLCNPKEIKRSFLLENDELNLRFPNIPFEMDYYIASFQWIATISDFSRIVPVLGNKFSKELIQTIKDIDDDKAMVFTNIKAIDPNGKLVSLPDFSVKLIVD